MRVRNWWFFGLMLGAVACGSTRRGPTPAPSADAAGQGSSDAGAPSAAGGSLGEGGAGTPNEGGAAQGLDPVVPCQPRERSCDGNHIVECNADKVSRTKIDTCGAAYHCELVPPGLPTCLPDACQVGQKLCVGNVIKTCTDESKPPGPEEEGVDCGADACWGGVCVPRICEPGKMRCQDGDTAHRYACNHLGTDWVVDETCGRGTLCAEVAGQVDCFEAQCRPGLTLCLANQVGVCAANGQGLDSVESDCSSIGKVCAQNLTCQDNTVDTITADSGSLLEYLHDDDRIFLGNRIEVTSSRTLTRIESYLALDTSGTLDWYVFREVFVGAYDIEMKITTDYASGEGYFDSGPVSMGLVAGTRYLIGAAFAISGASFGDDRNILSPPISFGEVLGRAEGQISSTGSTMVGFIEGGAHRMRLTTGPFP